MNVSAHFLEIHLVQTNKRLCTQLVNQFGMLVFSTCTYHHGGGGGKVRVKKKEQFYRKSSGCILTNHECQGKGPFHILGRSVVQVGRRKSIRAGRVLALMILAAFPFQ